ncbi:MAG TPA: signal peptidase I [Gemmatimonadaceae bacterium]|nr:signal peptidase I [Gemmatimonadaceae bacterium]
MATQSNADSIRQPRPVSQVTRSHSARENLKSIVGALAIFLVLRVFLVEAYRIPSGSMIPTLLVGDWLFVNKAIYGAHIPFTNGSLPAFSEPRRGDVVVFVSPYQADEAARGNDPTPTLVKRLIGVPGDTVHMRDGVLYLNGIAQRQNYGASDASSVDAGNQTSPLFDWQNQATLRTSRFGPAPAQPTLDNWGPLVVPERHFFMMGDSRYNSKDSRYWGFVPRENVRGKPLFIYYSYNADDSDRPLPFLTDIRFSRIGHWIR